MVATLKRQLTDDEKDDIIKRFGRICYANGHVIPDDDQIQFDHIRAHVLGGDSELNNIAPMCAQHNREKGQLSLEDFRIKLQLDTFFKRHDKPTLRDLLAYLLERKDITSFGQSVAANKEKKDVLSLSSVDGVENHTLYTCPTTGWHYFYATLSVALIDSDDESDDSIGLQPRYLIKEKVFSLFRHFQNHPVLQPSIGRLEKSHIRLFDGQHKLAALLMNGRRIFECKIYIDPDLRLLNQTNIAAHDAYAQTRFYSSIMVLKLGAEFAKDFEDFKNSEIPALKSEQAFIYFLLNRPNSTLTKAEVNRRFRSHLYSSILSDSANRLDTYVSKGNRGTDEQPITMDMLEKSIFANFLYREPTIESMTSDAYRRDDEIKNAVELCNIIVDCGLHAWNPKAPSDDDERRRLQRIFGSKSMMAWSELLCDAVCARLELVDSDERARVFYRSLSPDDGKRIRKTVQRLFDWQRWAAPREDEIDRVLSDKNHPLKSGLNRRASHRAI